jgi:Tfp pilus assembly protein PilX
MLSWGRIAARLRDESGISLVIALGMTLVLSLTTVGVIEYTSAGSRTTSVSRSYVIAQTLAEAGLNNAQARLADPANNALTSSLLTPTSGGVTCPDGVSTCFESSYEGGAVQWFGTFNSTTNVWTITSWGLTTNPTNTAQTIRRRMQATTTIVADPTQPNNAAAWNYVLSTKTSNSTTCDVTISNNATIDVDFYVQGNLCMDNNALIIEPDHTKPVELVVHGKLQQSNNSKVGMSTSDRVSKAKIGGGCVSSISQTGHLCDPQTGDPFYVGEYTQSPTQIAAPVPDYSGWYSAAKPGPLFPCTTATGVLPAMWDNNTNLDLTTAGSAGTFNLTPTSSSYSCTYVQSGQTIGELTWVHTTKTLTVKGAMYFDGSMTISGATLVYNGSATIYLTGTLNFGIDTKLCAVNVGSACDFTTWNPSTEMLIFVVNGGAATNSVVMSNNVHFQGGIQAKKVVNLSNNVNVEGPLIAEQIVISNNVILQPLPTITDLPLGAPGNPNTHASPTAPTYG